MSAGDTERFWLEGLRRMDPGEKFSRVLALNRAVLRLARERIRQWHGPDVSEREIRLRLASLWLSPDLMKSVFGWDPEKEGY